MIHILATSTEIKQKLSIAWRYAKIELAPPLTISFLHGPAGQKLERIVSNASDSLISSLSNKIKELDAEVERAKQEKEAVLKKALEKAKMEEKKKADGKKKLTAVAEKPKNDTAAKKSEPPKK